MSLTLNEYQKIARSTAIYPGQHTPLGLMYTALKGAGEAGEFAEQVGKAIRDDGYGKVQDDGYGKVGKDLTRERREKLVKELGDELWYVANKAAELGIDLEDVAQINANKLRQREREGKLQGEGSDR